MGAVEYLLLFMGLTSLVVFSISLSYHYLASRSVRQLDYLKLHMVIETVANRPCSSVRLVFYVPEGVAVRFSDNEVRVYGCEVEGQLIAKLDPSNIVVEATRSSIRYSVSFNDVVLKGGYVYELLIKSEPSRIAITVVSYRRG